MNRVLFVAGVVLLFAAMVYGVHETFTAAVPGANDFYSRWRGAQLFWQDGLDPYSDEASNLIQQGIYGRLALPTEDQVLFVYPFFTVFLLWPLVGLPYDWVQAIWLVVVQFSLITAVLLCLHLVKWQVPLWLLAITLLWSVAFYNNTRTIILGQFAGPILLCLTGCLLALQYRRDELAGALLAFTTIKPQMVFLLIPALLLWAIGQKRWRFITGFGITLAGLFGLSFLFLPEWMTGFLAQVGYYPAYTITGSPLWVLTGYYWPALGKPVEYTVIGLLVVYMLYQWRRLPNITADSPHFLLLIGLTLVITNMIVVRTATTNYIVMYIPLFYFLKQLANRPAGNLWVATFYVVSSITTWGLFLATITGDQEHPINYLPLPFLLLGCLIWALRNNIALKSFESEGGS